MYLQRTTGTAEGRGGVYPRKYDHLQSSIVETATRYPCRRSYIPQATSPTSPCVPLNLTDDATRHAHSSSTFSPSRSPPSPVTTVLPSGGVFLPNYKLSADFLQLRTEAKASPVLVRLYLTATELVKKCSFSPSGCNGSVAHEANGKLSGGEITISRYRLQDIEVSHSKVSAETMLVAVSQSSDVNGTPALRDSVGVVTTNTIDAASASHSPTTDTIEGGEPSVDRGPVISVEAYQLISGQESNIDDWISHVVQGKRKLVILDKLQRNNSHGTSTAAELVNRQLQASPNNKHSSNRPTSIAISSKGSVTGGQRKRGETAHYRRSMCGYDFPTQTPSSPTSKKLPTTTNGRYTPLHHHYSPHRLFSNTQVRSSSSGVQSRHTPEKDPFRIFRRFSLGGGSGTYRFPSPPANTPTNTSMQGASEGEMLFEKVGEGLTGYGVLARENHSLPSSSRTSPVPSPSHKSPLVSRRNATLSQQSTQQHDILRRKRRPTFSRSVSEYHSNSGSDITAAHSERETTLWRDAIQHQVSDPLPNGTATGGSHVQEGCPGDDGGGNRESSVPPELRELQSFLTSLPTPSNDPSTFTASPSSPPLTHSSPSPSDNEGEEKGFQSFLRHKQIRGRKIHVSPRAHSHSHSASVSSELLSPPAWVDKFSLPSSSPSSAASKTTQGGSATLPRGVKLKSAGTTGISKTLDREVHSGSSSPVPSTKLSKTPKIFKRFHRRWQSSSGVKLEQDMIPASALASGDVKPPPPPPPPPSHPQPPEKLCLLPAKEVAEGLTSMDAELLGCISPDEIRDGAWMKRGEKERLAPNVLAMVQSFNQLALLVPTEILDEQTQHQRAKVISAYIQIASKCYVLKNYNSLKAILAGLQSTPVYRLQRTWKYVPSKRRKRFNMLCTLMSEENNWQSYRDELDGCLASTTPCIPYLGQYLTQVCHQLSYSKMRAEKDEVKLRRRSKSFVGTESERKKEAMRLRRRSSSFHHSSLEFGRDGKRASVASVSTPVSPVISEDENESLEHEGRSSVRVVQQTGRTDAEEDAQSLEFSLSLDDRALDMSVSQSQTADVTASLPAANSNDLGRSGGSRKRLSSQKSIRNFHSTPVKDANGYIRPLCPPFARELNFDNCPVGQAFDEPDFGEHFGRDHDDLVEKDHAKWSDEDGGASFRLKIPSISLQRTSSHSSTEEWGEEGNARTRSEVRQQIRKSRSLESSLSSSLRNVNEGEGARHSLGRRLTPSHSIPSLDSDSVFSVGEGEGESEGGREREGEKSEKEGEGENENAEESDKTQQKGTSLVLECSLESEFSREEKSSSFTTHESSLQGLGHKTIDSSVMPLTTENREQTKLKSHKSPQDDNRTKTRRPSIQRSKSASGLTNYRHKWRWKKAVALASKELPPSTLTNADPFDLLCTYQKRSRNCLSINPSPKVDFKAFLNMFSNNSETRNYELSFEREP